MDRESWNVLLDYYTKEDNIHRAEVNSANKAKQQYPSYHGSKSYVETRYERHQADGVYPSLIDSFRLNHTRNDTFPIGSLAQQQYEQMLALKEAQIDVPNPLTEEQIIAQVLGTRRGHNRGRGQVVRRANSSSIFLAERSSSGVGNSSCAQSSRVGERSYTQAEVDSLVASSCSRLENKFNAVIRGLKANNIEIEFEEEEERDGDGDED